MSAIHAITMPKWGLEMTEGTISAWRFGEGDKVPKGAEFAEVETAKIVNTLELDVEGVVSRLLAKVGDTLPVGALIAVVSEAGASDADVDTFVSRFKSTAIGSENIKPAEAPPPPAPVAANGAAPATTAPAAPKPADPELEKRNEAAYASPIARRLANKLGVDLATVTGTGPKGRISQEDVEAVSGKPAVPASEPVAASAAPAPAPVSSSADIEKLNEAAHASPLARRLANKLGIDLSRITGTGARGRISQEDVEAAAAASGKSAAPPAAEPAPAAAPAPVAAPAPAAVAAKPGDGFDLIPHTPMRKAIAAALVQAKQTIPHFYLTVDVGMDKLVALRQELNGHRPAEKLSVNDFILRATALALVATPSANVHFTDEGVKQFKSVNLSVAVAIDGGLLTPVIHDAGSKSVRTISKAVADLAQRARSRKLTQEDLAGGTFTVSNLGMFGVRQFEAIINPPQGAILAVGQSRREAYEAEGGGVAFKTVMSVTLSSDHRVIDGALGAQFLAEFKRLVENPLSLLE